MSNTIKCRISNFKHIHIFLHYMIFPHLPYCTTSWSQVIVTYLNSLYYIYKKSLKCWTKSHNTTNSLSFYSLSFENVIFFFDVRLVYNITHSLAPPILKHFVKLCSESDFSSNEKPLKKWNSLPSYFKTSPHFYSFSMILRWIKKNQECYH